jgi:hypothetical protein
MSTVIEHDSTGNPLVAGDDFNVERDVPNVTTSDPLVKAWLTIKVNRTDADPGVVQKIITTTSVPGTGHIAQDGSINNGDGTASLRFELTAVNTALLGALVRYHFDIQVKTAAGKISTPDMGRLQLTPGVTDATS